MTTVVNFLFDENPETDNTEDVLANVSSLAEDVYTNVSSWLGGGNETNYYEAEANASSSFAEDVIANVSSWLGGESNDTNYYETTYYNESYGAGADYENTYYAGNDTYGDKPYGYEEEYGDPYGDSAYGYGDNAYGGGYGKKKEYGEDFYYGAMSVAVLTLGLVVIVEYILHNIDMSAIGKPFNQAVLDAVYRELAVLGIVELGIHIMQQYYEYDKDKKAVFADVHFLLFYTDIFNAFQAVIQAWATNLMTQRLWVRTEELELDHYVEIREEYDRVHTELYGVPPQDMSSSLKDEDVLRKRRSGWVNSVKNWITRPNLKIKYKELLLQVRFHELRVHFLQAYNLPLKLKVSDYLMRSENQIMINLVHISPQAWLWLTAICNALYFFAGIIADQTGQSNDTATFYSICFFVSMVVFVIASLLMDKHMELIFHRIMKSTRLWAHHEDDVETEEDEELADEQRSLFFLNNPDLVVTIIQFMQFGYAIALSVVFVYWKDMQKDEEFAAWPYLVSSVFCYILFVYNMSRVIPRYTLCSKLGQLVDKELLRETVASYKLKEEERHRATGTTGKDFYYDPMGGNTDGTEDASSTESPTETVVMEKAIRSLSNDSDEQTKTDLSIDTATTLQNRPSIASVSSGISHKDLVSMDTAALRALQRKQSRRSSRKSMSEGVALMRQMTEEEEEEEVKPTANAFRPRKTNNKTKSQSDGVNAMLEEPEPSEGSTWSEGRARTRESLLMDLVKMDTTSVRNVLDASSNSMNNSMNNSSSRRGARWKSRSAGVADMAAMTDIQEGVPAEQVPLFDTNSSLLDNSSQVGRVVTARKQQRMKTNSAGALIQQMRAAGATAMESTKQVVVSAVPATTGFKLPFDPPSDDDASAGALSDVDDVDPAEHNPPIEESYKEPYSLNKWLCEFFTGPKYRLSCHIGGTMIIFFLVAMRVEGFLQKQCIVPEDDYSWDFPLEWSFLLEFLWLTVYLAGAVMVMLTFSMKEGELNRLEWTTVIAAIMNVALMGLCLALLLGAEAQRCCTDSEGYYEEEAYGEESELSSSYYGRFLADYDDEKDVCKDATLQCECADFGFRVHGGLGSMEPWTALIALQVFRFIVASKICEWYNLGEEDHHHHHHGHGHGHGHGHAMGPDAIADAWQAAVAKNPDLVEKYGEFSSEVLQAMLGLEVIERPTGNGGVLPALTDGPSKENNNQMVVSGQQAACVTLQDDQYKKLAPEVQEIIAAGKCGMAVRCTVRTAAPMAPLEFEVDTRQMERLQMTTTLEFPNARIIRAVRRCDKMYLPLLDTWKTVDVILTNHEMLYVDVNDMDGSMEDQKKRIASTQALVATKGGKGLRLCDITAGRRVVGHLSLADITAVHVDREMQKPKDGKPEPKEIDVDVEASKKLLQAHEIWQPGGDEHFDGSSFAERWEDVPQDKLHIDTSHGTLYLRFYSDLKECEQKKDLHADEPEDAVHKDIAFQWAQTLVHLVHKQLKQSLPHFGEKGEGELRDYLHMVSC